MTDGLLLSTQDIFDYILYSSKFLNSPNATSCWKWCSMMRDAALTLHVDMTMFASSHNVLELIHNGSISMLLFKTHNCEPTLKCRDFSKLYLDWRPRRRYLVHIITCREQSPPSPPLQYIIPQSVEKAYLLKQGPFQSLCSSPKQPRSPQT